MNPRRNLVLVGAGHAHLHLAAHAQSFIRRGFHVLLIDPGNFWYSGMATGMLGGLYEPAEDQLDACALIESQGGEFIQDRVEAVDANRRQLTLAGGDQLTYDYLSINVGSQVNPEAFAGIAGDASVWAVKPISNLYKLRRFIETRLQEGGVALPLIVIGGGPTGCEVAANLAGLAERCKGAIHVTLITSGSRLIEQAPERAARRLYRKLTQRGIEIRTNTRIAARGVGILVTEAGESINAECVVQATGLEAHPLAQNTGLPSDPKRGLRINRNCRSISDSRIFAAGDCAAMEGYQLPKLGLFSVRQASCIHANLIATMDAKPLRAYRPQTRYLTILNLGDGTGLAIRGSLWWHGRISLWLKDFIDRRFLGAYRRRCP